LGDFWAAFLPLFFGPIFTVPFRLVSALEIACFIELFGNWPPFCRILQIRPSNAVCPMPASLKCDVESLVSGATLNVDLPIIFGAVFELHFGPPF
jgi:hypothetical protein